VNISSLAGLRGAPIYAAYSASKGAVRTLTKTVAAHCLERGDAIRCNSIHPGGVNTPMIHRLLGRGAALAEAEDPDAAARALGMGMPIDIANLVVYLASDESRFVNGAEIAIDGGSSALVGDTRPRRPAS
jgi:3(or 17)beta-hydroxysteroid dehydrogenase